MSAELNGADRSRLRTRPASGMLRRTAGGTTKARRCTSAKKVSSPSSRESGSAIVLSSDLSQKKRSKQSNLICRTKSLLRRRFRRSARDHDFCADFSKDWLSMPNGIHCCRHDWP